MPATDCIASVPKLGTSRLREEMVTKEWTRRIEVSELVIGR